MKRIILIFFTLISFVCIAIGGPTYKWNQAFQNYFDKYKSLAIREMVRYHIPASITLAQGVLESSAGQSRLATLANNHFGIKCHGWTGRTISHDDDLRGECFRAYDSVLESYEDHSKFLTSRAHYRNLFSLELTDYKGWAHGLKRSGYATSSTYAPKLIAIIELYRLYEYDDPSLYKPEIAPHPTKPIEIPLPKIDVKDAPKFHKVRAFNNNYYIVANNGDTFKAIAKEFDTHASKLAKYNERDKKEILCEGDIVWFKKKQKRAPKKYRNAPHTVRQNESLYLIAQLYGIRLKNLAKMNKNAVIRGIKVGDKIRIY